MTTPVTDKLPTPLPDPADQSTWPARSLAAFNALNPVLASIDESCEWVDIQVAELGGSVAGTAAAAAASAAAAAGSATAASGSASAAAGSATSAAGSATAAATSAPAAATSATEAAAQSEKYLGASATDPTVDKTGSALTPGDWYVNTASGTIRVYTGSAWAQGLASTTVAGVSSFNGATGDVTGVASVNGSTGAVTGVVTESGTQTLTNKTLTGGTVNPTTLQQGGVPAVTTTGVQTLTNKTLTDPVLQFGGSSGTAGQVPVATGTAGGVAWQTPAGGADIKVLHVQHQLPSGTSSGSAGTGARGQAVTRPLNTVVANTISGASLASNLITLPAGKYVISAGGMHYKGGTGILNRLAWANNGTAVLIVIGLGSEGYSDYQYFSEAHLRGYFEIAASTVFKLNQYASWQNGGNDFGVPQSVFGVPEVYADVLIQKVG